MSWRVLIQYLYLYLYLYTYILSTAGPAELRKPSRMTRVNLILEAIVQAGTDVHVFRDSEVVPEMREWG